MRCPIHWTQRDTNLPCQRRLLATKPMATLPFHLLSSMPSSALECTDTRNWSKRHCPLHEGQYKKNHVYECGHKDPCGHFRYSWHTGVPKPPPQKKTFHPTDNIPRSILDLCTQPSWFIPARLHARRNPLCVPQYKKKNWSKRHSPAFHDGQYKKKKRVQEA